MSLIPLLTMDNYISFNISLANTLGLKEAVYISELLNINDKAVRKSKTTNDFFTVDRKYIQSRTTITEAEQLKIDKSLFELGLLKQSEENANTINLDINVLMSVVTADDAVIADLRKIVSKLNKPKKLTKQDQEKELVKAVIKTTNVELRAAYEEWVDSVYAKLGWMSRKAVTVAETLVDETADHDLDVALKILEIATVNGYKDITWAVKQYQENFQVSYRIKSQPKQQQRATGLSQEAF